MGQRNHKKPFELHNFSEMCFVACLDLGTRI